MRICNVCHKKKDLIEFYRDKQMSDGRRKNCKTCKNKQTGKWRIRNVENWNSYMRKYRKEHPLSIKDKIHKYNRVLRCRYGLDLGTYDKILSDQKNKCLICEKHTSEIKRKLVVDHCHKTKKVRGLLCDGCNVAISILENPDLLAKAQSYLQKYS